MHLEFWLRDGIYQYKTLLAPAIANVVVNATCILQNFLKMPSYKTVLQVKCHAVNVQADALVNLGNMCRVHPANAVCKVRNYFIDFFRREIGMENWPNEATCLAYSVLLYAKQCTIYLAIWLTTFK